MCGKRGSGITNSSAWAYAGKADNELFASFHRMRPHLEAVASTAIIDGHNAL